MSKNLIAKDSEIFFKGSMSYFIFVIFLLFQAYFFHYFKEKGKNLATKEDIREITKTTEEVKVFVQSSLKFKETAKYHLFKIYEMAYTLKFVTDINMDSIRSTSPKHKELTDYQSNLEQGFKNLKLSIYAYYPYSTSENKNFIPKIDDLLKSADELELGFKSKEFINYKCNSYEFRIDIKKMDNDEIKKKLSEGKELEKMFLNKITPLRKKYTDSILGFSNELKSIVKDFSI